jgi:hypothetical protein
MKNQNQSKPPNSIVMENVKKSPQDFAAEARKKRKTSDSNKRQRIVAAKSHPPTSSSIPNSSNHHQLPLSDITPSKSNSNIDAEISPTLTHSIPVTSPGSSLSSAQKFSQQYGSTPSMCQSFSNQTRSFYITDVSVPMDQVGTKRKRHDPINVFDKHIERTNTNEHRQNTTHHTQQRDVLNSINPPPRQHHYATRGVNLYNKFTSTITPDEPSTSTSEIPKKNKSQYSHIFENHTIDDSESNSDSNSESDSAESNHSASQTESDDDTDTQDADQEDEEGNSNAAQSPLIHFFIYKLTILLNIYL